MGNESENSGQVVRDNQHPVVQPDICSSFRCNPPTDYCAKCSHAFFFGSAKVKGITYRWEHNPYHGPMFSRSKDGECLWIPSEKHPVWKAFERWLKREPRLNPSRQDSAAGNTP